MNAEGGEGASLEFAERRVLEEDSDEW